MTIICMDCSTPLNADTLADGTIRVCKCDTCCGPETRGAHADTNRALATVARLRMGCIDLPAPSEAANDDQLFRLIAGRVGDLALAETSNDMLMASVPAASLLVQMIERILREADGR